MKVTRKFIIALIAGIVLVHAGSAALRVHREVALFHEDIARDSRVLGRALSHAVERAWRTEGEQAALGLIAHATEREAHVRIRWVWPDGKRGPAETPTADSATLAPLHQLQTVVVRLGKGDESAVCTYVPVRVTGGRLGAVEVTDPLGDEEEYMRGSIVSATATALTLVALSAGLAWLLGVVLIGRPVRALVEQARRVAGGDLAQRLVPRSRDELGELAIEMNHMCDGLQGAWQRAADESQARIQAIEQLRHVDRLKTVGTLASGVAHELGTPINVIEGHVQLLREDPASTEAMRGSLDVITRQCKRMAEIIRQLLDFSHRGVKKSEPPADLRDVVRETARMLEPMARKRDVSINVEVGLTAAVAGIGFGQAQQVLANLAINGIHAMPKGGQLRFSVAWQERKSPGRDRSAPYLCVEVADDGMGMDEETRGRIFEPFFTTKDVGTGTGLGLAVAHGIIEDRGGWIEVDSAPGQGSRFVVCLPAPTTVGGDA